MSIAFGGVLVISVSAAPSIFNNQGYSDLLDRLLETDNNLKLFFSNIADYQYRLTFFCQYSSYNGQFGNFVMYGIGSSDPIKFLVSNGKIGISVNANSKPVVLTGSFYPGSGGFWLVDGLWSTSVFNFEPNAASSSYGHFEPQSWFNSNFGSNFLCNFQYFIYGDNNTPPDPSLSSGWMYEEGTGVYLYDGFTDDQPVDITTAIHGGGGRTYEDYYSYDYEVDSNGDYVPGSGNIQFDFGAAEKARNFFNKGFFGEIRTWIRQGNDGADIRPMTLFAFDTSFGGHRLSSEGFTLDFNDRHSFVSLLAYIVFPVFAFEVLVNMWGLVFKILTGVDLLHIDIKDEIDFTYNGGYSGDYW